MPEWQSLLSWGRKLWRAGFTIRLPKAEHKAFRHLGCRADYQHLSSLNINSEAA